MKQLTKDRLIVPLMAILPMILFFITEIFLGTVYFAVNEATGGNSEASELVKLIIISISKLCGAAAACFIVRKRNGTTLKDVIKVKDFDFTVVLLLLLFTWSAGELCDHMTGLILSQHMEITLDANNEDIIYSLISGVICAPIFEEIIFRFGGCETAIGTYSLPLICIANSIYFSVVHGYNIQNSLNVVIAGACAAYIYAKTRNILYVILEHAAHNALCIIDFESITLFGEPLYTSKNGFVLGAWYWLVFNGAIVILCAVWYIKKFRPKYREDMFKINRNADITAAEGK